MPEDYGLFEATINGTVINGGVCQGTEIEVSKFLSLCDFRNDSFNLTTTANLVLARQSVIKAVLVSKSLKLRINMACQRVTAFRLTFKK